MGYIYIFTSPSGKSYIGQTIRPVEKRIEEHRKGKKGCRLIHNAIQKHRWENFKIDWYECPDEDLNDHEEFLVEVLETLTPNGYNLIEGGGSHGKPSEESKQKMSDAKKGDKSVWYGKKHNEETKQKQRDAMLGDNNHNAKRVYQYDLEWNYIDWFESCGEAARKLKKANGSSISRCARGQLETAYKFKWSYVEM